MSFIRHKSVSCVRCTTNYRPKSGCEECLRMIALTISMVIWAIVTSSHTSAQTSPTGESQDDDDSVYFERAVRPILKAHCFLCHGEEKEKGGGLDLRLVRLMISGGDSGAAISLDALIALCSGREFAAMKCRQVRKS